MGGVTPANPGLDTAAIKKMQDDSFKQQLDLMSIQQKKADQDTLVNAQSSEIKSDRDSKSTLGRNLA
jgi:hypothetical protein